MSPTKRERKNIELPGESLSFRLGPQAPKRKGKRVTFSSAAPFDAVKRFLSKTPCRRPNRARPLGN